jgi:outer membrane protein OmpA-like peptidoglycan-associated protein
MSDYSVVFEDEEDVGAWPAFADLFSATSLMFITFLAAFVYVTLLNNTGVRTRKKLIEDRLVVVSENQSLFRVDTTDLQYVRIILRERATFPQGSYLWESLREEGQNALMGIGRALNDSTLRGLYREIRVVGHTDRVPLNSVGFTNWELSASRAAVVARFLVDRVNVDPCKISATGRASYFPVNDVNLEENRRIEIQIVPQVASVKAETERCMPSGDGARADTATSRESTEGAGGSPTAFGSATLIFPRRQWTHSQCFRWSDSSCARYYRRSGPISYRLHGMTAPSVRLAVVQAHKR